MSELYKHQMFMRMGVNSTATARTGTPSSWYWVPVFEDGVAMTGSVETSDINTEHKDRGNKYRIFARRNHEGGQIRTPMYPQNAALLLGAAVNNTAGLPHYHSVEQYWGAGVLDSGSGTGRKLSGVLFGGMTLNIDRSGPGPVELQLDGMLNQDTEITGAAPDPTWPSNGPYDTRNVFVDVDLNESGFGGNNVDVKSLSITFNQGVEVDAYLPSATDSLNGAWTKAYPGTPEVTCEFSLVVTNSAYVDLLRNNTLRTVQVRVMGYSPEGVNTTSTDNESAGTGNTFTVASAAGLTVNDYILLWDSANNKQAVAKIASISGSDVTIDTLDVAVNGSVTALEIYNTAWEIKIPKLEIVSVSAPTIAGAVRIVNVSARAKLESGQTSLLSVKAYNES